MILTKIVEAIVRLEGKLEEMASAIGPLCQEVEKNRIANKVDRELLTQLLMQVQGVRGLEAEAICIYNDRLSDKRQKESGKGHPDLELIRSVLDEVCQGRLGTEIKKQVQTETAGVMERINSAVKKQTEELMSTTKSSVDAAQSRLDTVMKLLGDIQKTVDQGVGAMVDESIKDTKDKLKNSVQTSNDIIDDLKDRVEEQLEDVKADQKRISTNLDLIDGIASNYDKKIRGALGAASLAMRKTRDELLGRADMELSAHRVEVGRLLEESEARKVSILKEITEKNEQSARHVQRALQEKLSILEKRREELDKLVQDANSSIMEINKNIATTGNNTPRDKRVRIRSGR